MIRNKKGQISVFIILGVIIMVVIVLALRSNIVVKRGNIAEIEPITEYVENCIREKVFEGVDILEKQGGLIYLDEGLSIYSGERKVAYWYDEVIKIPSLKDMELELERYIEGNCEDFSNFEDFDVEILGKMEVDVKIGDKINVDASFPLNIERNEIKYDVNNFNVEVSSNLKELYELGKEIMRKENSDLFLEDKTMDLLTLYGLPLSGASLDCEDKIWIKSDLKEKTKNVLAVGLPFVGVRNTNFEGYDNELRMFEWDVTNKNYDVDVDVLFYQSWPFDFDVNPSKGEIVRGDSVKETWDFGVFCFARYHFVYDLDFPVVFKMEKDGDEMYFATKVKIVSNNPRENDLVFSYEDEEFCNENLKEIKVNEDFEIGFICDEKICSNEVVDGIVELPDCEGLVVASKEGYVSEGKVVSDEMEFELEKITEMKFKIRKQDKNGIKELEDNEMVIINLVNEEKNFESYAVSSQMDKIELVEGKYNVNMMLIKEEKMKFPGKTVEYCVGYKEKLTGVCVGTKKSIKIPAVDLDQVVVGGAEYEHEFKTDDLEKEGLIFYVWEDKVKNIDDVGKVMEKLEEYGKKVKKVG